MAVRKYRRSNIILVISRYVLAIVTSSKCLIEDSINRKFHKVGKSHHNLFMISSPKSGIILSSFENIYFFLVFLKLVG